MSNLPTLADEYLVAECTVDPYDSETS